MTEKERFILYYEQKKLLDTFLAKKAIDKKQYDKSFGDLTVKMGMNNASGITVEPTCDIESCLAARFKVFVEEQNVPVELEKDEYDSERDDCVHFLIKKYDMPVGAFRCTDEGNGSVHFQRFCILKEYRELGIGRKAIEFAEDYYRNKGFIKITLNAQCRAIGFYEKCGFTVVSDVFDDAGIPHRAMEKMIF
jgi:predicted GNAT family N-acyltransferase